jgi:hypothetical protein
VCEYPPAKIPLRERRALERGGEAQPWEQSPWDVSKGSKRPGVSSSNTLARQLVLSGNAKTFNVAIDMPLRSQELFHYCKILCPYRKYLDLLLTSLSRSLRSGSEIWRISRPEQRQVCSFLAHSPDTKSNVL